MQIPEIPYIELLLPLWHRNTKKGKERSYSTHRRSLKVFFCIPIIASHIIIIIMLLRLLDGVPRGGLAGSHVLDVSLVDMNRVPLCIGQGALRLDSRSSSMRKRRIRPLIRRKDFDHLPYEVVLIFFLALTILLLVNVFVHANENPLKKVGLLHMVLHFP
jgi:hypothetical protein